MLYDSGAKEVHVRIACPEIKFPDFYGVDTPTKKELDIIDVSSIDFTDEDFQKWYNENFSDKKYELVNP